MTVEAHKETLGFQVEVQQKSEAVLWPAVCDSVGWWINRVL